MITMSTSLGTIATEEEVFLNLPEEVNITTTPYINTDILFHNLSKELDTLESNSTITLHDILKVEEMLNGLVHNSERYLECQFRIRSLKKYINNRAIKESTHLNKTHSESIETFLINEGIQSFLNLGSLGRAWVVSNLKYKNVDDLKQDNYIEELESKISLLDNHISRLKVASDIHDLDSILQVLNIHLTEDGEVLNFTLDKWVNQPKDNIITLAQAKKTVYNLKDEVYKYGVSKTTITEEIYSDLK